MTWSYLLPHVLQTRRLFRIALLDTLYAYYAYIPAITNIPVQRRKENGRFPLPLKCVSPYTT
jgi:hypothetical protein